MRRARPAPPVGARGGRPGPAAHGAAGRRRPTGGRAPRVISSARGPGVRPSRRA
ncbi:hypothetical protein [Ornithinimicrobium kibberense]|uniref:hypothetical protein n=1 Tax=Ornithinimicrobium kibberense TaxID=282060 RepID=UPI00361C390A